MASIVSPVPSRGQISPRQFAGLRRNIENTYKAADPDVRAAGAIWYPARYDEAEAVGKMARVHGGGSEQEMSDVERGAGIISALSPQMPWERNVEYAREIARHGKTNGSTKVFRGNALAIREGIHPRDVLDPERTGGKSHKTWNFFQNIAEPDDPHPVTIDRHAHDIAIGRRLGDDAINPRGLSAEGRYNNFAEAYRQAAHHLGIERTNSLQAATWLHWTGRPE